MKTTLKHAASRLLPPLVVEAVRSLRRPPAGEPAQWEYVPSGWDYVDPALTGWDVDSIEQAQLSRWPAFLDAVHTTDPLSIAHESATLIRNHATHNTVMCFGYVLARVARQRTHLSVLDWGGGLGHYLEFARALLPEVTFDYHVKDVPRLCAAGRRVLPEVTFHEDERCLDRTYDLVMASGSFQYARDWRDLAGKLARATGEWLYVTRLPIVPTAPSFVVIQRPAVHGYKTEFLGWFLNRAEWLDEVSRHGRTLVREFQLQERPPVLGAPEQADYRGFLFR